MALAKMLEFLATQMLSLSDIVVNLPPYHIAKRKTPCAWEAKARVMRLIGEKLENYDNQASQGIKVAFGPDKWVLITPDPDQPYFRVTTEATSQEEAETLANDYVALVEKFAPK